MRCLDGSWGVATSKNINGSRIDEFSFLFRYWVSGFPHFISKREVCPYWLYAFFVRLFVAYNFWSGVSGVREDSPNTGGDLIIYCLSYLHFTRSPQTPPNCPVHSGKPSGHFQSLMLLIMARAYSSISNLLFQVSQSAANSLEPWIRTQHLRRTILIWFVIQ